MKKTEKNIEYIVDDTNNIFVICLTDEQLNDNSVITNLKYSNGVDIVDRDKSFIMFNNQTFNLNFNKLHKSINKVQIIMNNVMSGINYDIIKDSIKLSNIVYGTISQTLIIGEYIKHDNEWHLVKENIFSEYNLYNHIASKYDGIVLI